MNLIETSLLNGHNSAYCRYASGQSYLSERYSRDHTDVIFSGILEEDLNIGITFAFALGMIIFNLFLYLIPLPAFVKAKFREWGGAISRRVLFIFWFLSRPFAVEIEIKFVYKRLHFIKWGTLSFLKYNFFMGLFLIVWEQLLKDCTCWILSKDIFFIISNDYT